MSSSQNRRESQEDSSSNGRPRVEPSFFGNQLRNSDSSQSKQPPKDRRHDETHWENPPPPYSPPSEPSLYPTGSTPSAPPLHEAIPSTNPSYQPHPTYSTSDSNIYPPHNYNQPTSYGSIQQPNSPLPSSPQNTSDAINFHWPWHVQSAQPNTESTPPSPITPIHPLTVTPPKKQRSCCRLFVIILCVLFVFLLLSNIASSLFGHDEIVYICTGGVPWAKLPHQIYFENSIRVSTSGGPLNSGRIILKNTDEEHPIPAIFVNSRVSPPDFKAIPGLDYSVIYNKDETHLKIQIPDSSHVCLAMDIEIYINNTTQTIAVDVQNSPINIDGDAIVNTSGLKIKTTNAPIRIKSPWKGTVLSLESTNGFIEITGPVTANSTVSLRTTNNHISTANIIAKDVISITSNNGYIKTGPLTSRIISAVTDNAALTVDSIHADQSELRTSNGKLVVPAGNITSTIKAATSNALLELHLSESNEEVVVIAETSNHEARLYMPDEFQGSFDISTSGRESIVFDDHNTHIITRFIEVGHGRLTGTRYADKILGGHITLKTSNASPYISFQE